MNEAELVLTEILNCDRLSLYLNKDTNLNLWQSTLLAGILERRALGEPLQYILGKTEFMGLELKVDNRVLIPRPETEILVQKVSAALESLPAHRLKFLDLGTGSGCIAIALAKNLPQAEVWASDISFAALELAKINANFHKVKIKFFQSDLLEPGKLSDGKFDLIISNPPYVANWQLAFLAQEISFEPALALAAGADGLDFYRRIIPQAALYLKPGGLLAFELGINQACAVKAMLEQENFKDLKIFNDYSNIPRVILGEKRI